MEQVCGGGMRGVIEFPLHQHNKEPFGSAFSKTLPEPYFANMHFNETLATIAFLQLKILMKSVGTAKLIKMLRSY